MDTEHKIRLNFLEEAEEYLDRMESNLLGLANNGINSQQIDLVLRSAHSIKGGAAMMGFTVLSQVAHRLEDFLKILRVRYTSSPIKMEVETLLLQSIDCLRGIRELYRQQLAVTDSDISDRPQGALHERAQAIFDQLQQYLGDLEVADEDALMAQDEGIDPALLIFEEGVDTVLDRFETHLKELGSGELAQELATTAQELIAFGNMANLEPFIQLCKSIQQQAATLLLTQEIASLAERALKAWRRSHALVLRGSIEKLPSCLENNNSVNTIPATIEPETLEVSEDDSPELSGLQSAFEEVQTSSAFAGGSTLELDSSEDSSDRQSPTDLDLLEDDSLELSGLQSAFEEVPAGSAFAGGSTLELDSSEAPSDRQSETDFDLLEDDSIELSGLQSAFDLDSSEAPSEEDLDSLEDDSSELLGLEFAFNLDTSEETPTIIPPETNDFSPSLSPPRKPSEDKMVRVPAAQLKQFNNLFEQLILDRNTINLRLKQLQNITSLMSQRITQIESSNTQLKQWYDKASIEGFLTKPKQSPDGLSFGHDGTSGTSLGGKPSSPLVSSNASWQGGVPSTNKEQLLQNSASSLNNNSYLAEGEAMSQHFDSLEMDRYSDIHLICQEQIETIVQLQEVATDIELGLQEINQAVRNLNYTTKSMQGNVTRTQMLPIAEVVKRFPRVIRDLNVQFNKQVDLKIIGKNTLLDRVVIEALSNPLMHLLRNSFDHGIEDPETRIAAGKNPSGTITIQASNQGTYTVITLTDDGKGISLDKIRDRLSQMGIPQSEVAQIPETELLDFIFEPGFSTAQQVTELSGRGVGLDVVRNNLQEIHGDVRVTTKPGKGTKFTLRIPFSLSILRVAIIEQAGIVFAIPVDSIGELLPLESERIKTSENLKYINWNGTEIPLVEIEKTLVYRRSHKNVNLTGSPAINRTMAIVVGDEKLVAALQISRFWHEQEYTIRSIDSPIPLPPGIISSMIFGDGKVIPLFEPILLVEECLKNHSTNDQSNQNFTENPYLSTTKTILVVDDSINVRRYLSLTLEKAGYQVEQAKDGQEALDKLLSGLSVQAVICDIEMPRLDGYKVLEEIKERAEFEHLPIAMLTSRSNEKHRKLAMNLGASAYFSKPYNEQELLNKLAELLQS